MKLTPILLFALLFTLGTGLAHANDYIITTKGDTVTATIKVDFWNGKVLYQLPGSKKAMRVDDGNVKEYYWSAMKNPTFVVMTIPERDKPVFVELLVKGKINLYEFVSRTSKVSTKYWYASKGNSPIVEINNERRLFGVNKKLERNLVTLLADNEAVTNGFNKQQRYNFKSIKSLIEQYNAI